MPADRLTSPPAVPSARLPAGVPETARAVREVLAGTPLGEAALRADLDPAELATAVELFTTAGRRALAEQHGAHSRWTQLYLEFTHWASAEKTAAEHLAPLLHTAQRQGDLTGWWFIRKHPCWRLRLRTSHDAAKASVPAALDGLVTAGHLRRWWPGIIYEAETPAFGGGAAMTVAHELFTADSTGILALTRRGDRALGRRELSVLLCTTLMRAAALEWYEQGDAWHRVSEDRPLPSDVPPDRLQELAGNIATLLRADFAPDGPLWGPGGPAEFAADWAGAFRRAGQDLGAAARTGTLERGLRHVLAYHVIFHWNRLGLPLHTQSVLSWAARAAILDAPASPAPPAPGPGLQREGT
ncbi:thiopeptide-type bacteriocin biosynthesis protein [Peterkaempfera bronchialis]|uniref:Methyltransferase n=1 Tax=Peterkaempfera bronchialis TaxID=2126346 RepID=A0A345SUR7_9ACTN|nr:thiopeptide-type bacteriocin biosynthesis protein [Peterkaempfera bronchialis]AXI77472.1 methyltransferase [Peterkaempfera bronchialis]